MDITNHPKPTQTHITDQPAEHVDGPSVHPSRVVRKKTDFVGYVLVVGGVVALTVVLAVIGGGPMAWLIAVVTAVGVLHYCTWGRSLAREVAQEQAEDFKRRLERDKNTLPEIERPRHY